MGEDKPSALSDVRKGLGLLFRAAKTVSGRLPKQSVEEVLATSAREVGRAFENVASTIERQVFGRKGEAKPEDKTEKDEDEKKQDK